jgi:chorismate mutase
MVPNKYYLIRSDVLPEVFHKVINVKQLVDREDGLSINEACRRVKISRSAYYKYRDAVRLVQLENGCTAVQNADGRVQSFQVSDTQLGNKYALITAETSSAEASIAELKNKLQQVRGVKKVTILR